MSCGGKQGLTPERCKALAGRDVIVYADADATEEWKEKIKKLDYCRNISLSDWAKDEATNSKRDIADLILEQRKHIEKSTTVGDVCHWMDELGMSKGRVTLIFDVMEIEVINGQIIAKANHYQAVPGRGDTKRIIKDEVIRAYERSFIAQCKTYRDRRISSRFRLFVKVWHSSPRFDLDNSLKTLLGEQGVVVNLSNDYSQLEKTVRECRLSSKEF